MEAEPATGSASDCWIGLQPTKVIGPQEVSQNLEFDVREKSEKPIATGRFALNVADVRSKLESGTRLHWFHWTIILLSLVLSIIAWRYSSSVVEAQVKGRFDRECRQVIALVRERMKSYEDALWSGVAMARASGGELDVDQWQQYAGSLNIEKKYPGINGLGFIHSLTPQQIPAYLKQQRYVRPEFAIHPARDGSEYFPITFIVPVEGNEQAVGLDIGHESNRAAAASRSRDTGRSQITGPIRLVQDNEKTPGFLFFAPLYRGETTDSVESRQSNFTGLVYAPFVMNKLMQGTLEKEVRHVGIRLNDLDDVLYDEHQPSESDFDPDPLFKQSVDVNLYGRTWTFDIWSTLSFRAASHSSQPLLILLGGILIDGMLIVLFVSISRSSQNALVYADMMTDQLQQKTRELEKSQTLTAARARQLEISNSELKQFAYVASHDLQEPLRKVASFCGLLQQEYDHVLDDDGRQYIKFAIDGSKRMRNVIQDLLAFSNIGATDEINQPADAEIALETVKRNLALVITESEAIITNDPLPEVVAHQSSLVQLFEHLIGNSLKYKNHDQPLIHIGAQRRGDNWQFTVTDNGIGIAPEYHERIFGIFKRLHSQSEYQGTGIGLAICKRIIERLNGEIWVEPVSDSGCKFCFTIPVQPIDFDLEDINYRELEHANI